MTEHKRDRLFRLKIAVFNTVGFLYAVAVPVILDPTLHSHVAYGARTYPNAWWVVFVFAPTLFVLTYASMRYGGAFAKGAWSVGSLIIAGAAAIPFFRPEMPHSHIVGWVVLYSIITGLSSWIHYSSPCLDFVQDQAIPLPARIERLKDMVSFWNSVAVYIGTGYLALVVPWQIGNFAYFVPHVVTDPKEVLRMAGVETLGMVIYTSYVIFGPFREAIQKRELLADEYLNFREPRQVA